MIEDTRLICNDFAGINSAIVMCSDGFLLPFQVLSSLLTQNKTEDTYKTENTLKVSFPHFFQGLAFFYVQQENM